MGPQFNRGRFARDAKFISIQAVAMDGVFFRGFDNAAVNPDHRPVRAEFDFAATPPAGAPTRAELLQRIEALERQTLELKGLIQRLP